MAATDSHRNTRNRGGWRGLSVFWASVLSLMAIGAGVVQWLGPPEREVAEIPSLTVARAVSGIVDKPLIVIARPGLVAPPLAGRDTPGPVADADPTLLEPLGDGLRETLPRIASDGRSPMQVYAAGFDQSSRRPRVGLLLAGIGPNAAESDAAIRALPGAVSLAISPYEAANVTKLLATARTTGHEYLIEIPLEPVGFPLNDPGPATLLTSASTAANLQNLQWALSRIDGYVGATEVIGTMRGERLAAMTDQMEAVLSELSGRGLLYIDSREPRGPVAKTWGRHVDLVIDDLADAPDTTGGDAANNAMIDAKLAELEQRAKDTGTALGLVMRPAPVTVARIAAWYNGLSGRGFALAPVSALAMPPTDMPVKLSEREP